MIGFFSTPPPALQAAPPEPEVAVMTLRAYPVSGNPGVDPGTPKSGYQDHYNWYHSLGARAYPSCVITNALSTGPVQFQDFLPFSIDVNVTMGRGHHGSVWWHVGSTTDGDPTGLTNSEIDLCEYVVDANNLGVGLFISQGTIGADGDGAYEFGVTTETWRTHSIEVDGSDLVWKIDGVEKHRQASAPWLTLPVMLVVGFEIGGNWPGLPVDDDPKGQPADPTAGTPWPAEMRLRNLIIAGVNTNFAGEYGEVFDQQVAGFPWYDGTDFGAYWNAGYPFGYKRAVSYSYGDRRLFGNDGKEAACGNGWLGNTFDASPGTTSIVEALVADGWSDPFLHRVT